MSFTDKLGHFLAFILLSIITLGFYPLWFTLMTIKEHLELLREIKGILKTKE